MLVAASGYPFPYMSVSRSAALPPSGLGCATGHAHAKAILLGEHAVVHGAPAIALPVPELGVTVEVREGDGLIDSALYSGTLDAAPARLGPTIAAARSVLRRHGRADLDLSLRVSSSIPPERGLGSSAAVGAATVDAVLRLLGDDLNDPDVRHELIQEAERVAHGTPSGLDARAVVSDAPVWFHRRRFTRAVVGGPFAFVLADTGMPGDTRSAVDAVHAQLRDDPARVARAVDQLGQLVTAARDDLVSGNRDGLGMRMDEAHTLLQQLEVSSPELDRLVGAARDAGAVGAKLTGGGRGGCVIALAADADDAARLARSLRAAAAATWITTLKADA